MEHAQLIESAFAKYLPTANPSGANPAVNIWPQQLSFYAGENNLDKDGQRIVCYIEGGALGDEEPPNSGNRWFEISVELRTPFFKPTPAQIKAGVPDPIASHQAAASALQSAILNTSLPDALQAAQTGVTFFGITGRTQFREEQDNGWVSGWKVKGLSAPSSWAN